MTYAFVQQNANDNAATATTITVTLTPTAGNLLVFCVSGDALDTTSIALSDNLGSHNTFTQIGTDLVTSADQRCAWWFAANCKGGATTFTATFSATTRFRTIYVAEYSGIATTSPFLNGARAENANPGTGTDAVSSGNANATSQPALVWGFSLDINGGTTPTAGTGFTSRTGVWSTATCLGRPEDKRVTATGNVAATFTATTGTDPHGTGVGIFLEAAPVTPPLSWSPDFSDAAKARPSMSGAASGAAAPVFTPAPPVVPAMSWVSVTPDVASRSRAAVIIGGSAQPDATLPNASAPPLSWLPEFPDAARRSIGAAIVGGSAQPEATIVNPPAPPLSWAPGFSDLTRRVRAHGVQSDAAPLFPIPNSIFPLSVSASGRYLQQSDGTPFLICADTTWSLFVDIPIASLNMYLNDITAKGFNAVMGNAIEHHYTLVKPPKERGGALPFTQRLDGSAYTGSPNGTNGAAGTQGQFAGDPYGNINTQAPDWTFPNNAYWVIVESILDACRQANVAVFVWAAYLGFQANDEGWINEMVALDAVIGAGGFTGQPWADPTKSKLWNYGAWLANRWKAYPHIIWVMGGDYGTNTNSLTTAQRNAVNNVMAGLKSVAGQLSTLFTAHWDRPCVSTDVTLTAGAWDLNLAYTGEEVAQTTRLGYAATPAIPAFLGEDFYEGSSFGGSTPFRKYLYWGFLSGIAGGFYGHEQLWRFDDGTPGTDWTTLLSTTARNDAVRQFAFWKSKPWHRLKPSGLGGMGTLITAGGGTASPQTTNYVAAACTPEGDLLLAYIPPAHSGSITVDMTKLATPAIARWFDPTNASFTAIGTISNTGTHAFTPPATNSAGDTDFLLVLDALPSPPLSWSPDFPDEAPRARSAANVGGELAPASQIGSPSALHSWSTDEIDVPRRLQRSSAGGGEIAPPPPPLDTRLLVWSPSVVGAAPRHVAQLTGETMPALAPSPIPSTMSWLPVSLDRAARARAVASSGAAQPEAVLPNVAAPPLSWLPIFPDLSLRARSSANVGGLFMPDEVLPNPPAPPLSWLSSFSDGQIIRSRWTVSASDASMVVVVELPARPPLQIMQPRPGVGRAGVRRDGVSRAGVSRTGSVRLSLPSPTGEWNPQLDDNVVDFDRDAFTRFISDKGYDITWEKAVLCPNVSGAGLSPRDHAIGCRICGGGGYVYVDAITTKMLMQGIRMNQSFFAYGRWDVGNMLVTAEPEFTIDYFDRLTLGNGVGRYTQRLVRQPGAAVDRLKYAPLCFHYVAWVDRSNMLVPFIADVDFRISADGSSVEWFGVNQPDANSFYSVCYDYRPRYVVLDLVHHHRDSTIDGQHYAFPVQAVAKLDFLIRNEGQDARQVLDTNPFQ